MGEPQALTAEAALRRALAWNRVVQYQTDAGFHVAIDTLAKFLVPMVEGLGDECEKNQRLVDSRIQELASPFEVPKNG